MKVLVLGGASFIGSALIERLIKLGYSITAIDRYWPRKDPNVACIVGDVFDPALLDETMPGHDVVIHLVSTTVPATSNKSPIFDCETNVIGTLRILDAMVENGLGNIIFASSGGTAYGIPDVQPINELSANFPISAYGIGKVTIEKYLYLYSYLYGLHATSLRISNPFGPGQDPEKGQGVIAAFTYRAIRNLPIEIWGDGSVVRDFIYIDDVVDAFVASIESNKLFTILNIGLEKGYSLLDVLDLLQVKLGHNIPVEFRPSRNCDVPSIILDTQKAQSEIGWTPQHSFEQGLEKLITHIKLQLLDEPPS